MKEMNKQKIHNKNSLGLKMLALAVLPVLALGIVLLGVGMHAFSKSMENHVQKEMTEETKLILKILDQNYPGEFSLNKDEKGNYHIYKGGKDITKDTEFIDNMKEIGLALTGQTGNLAPADKKIYALRDVTAIVDSIPLIASSIMSKKIAAGAGAIVLDVKVGSGAFMKNMQDAEKLAEEMVKIGSLAGRNTIAVISDMDEPLGLAVGNALEVAEAVKTLKKEGPEDLINLCLELGTQMLIASKVEENADKARGMLQNSIDDGSAYNKFLEFIKRQGGDITVFDDLDEFTECNYKIEVKADKEGYVQRIESELIGEASMILGGGRMTKEDVIDYSVGVKLSAKRGDYVKCGDCLATIYAANKDKILEAEGLIIKAFEISEDIVKTSPLIKRIISCKNI